MTEIIEMDKKKKTFNRNVAYFLPENPEIILFVCCVLNGGRGMLTREAEKLESLFMSFFPF